MKNKLISFLPLLIVISVSFLTILPLFQKGFFPMHDNTQVQRVFEMHKALHDGMLPVRWVPDLGYGYGYPLFNFYGPLAYYVGGLFLVLVTDALVATKIMIAVGMIGSSITMYLLGKSLWGKFGGIISSILYVLAPYHAVDLYVRGDIGELWAYMFIPLVFYGFYRLFIEINSLKNSDEKSWQLIAYSLSWKWIGVGSLGFAGVILSHNLSAFMLAPFLLVFWVALVFCSNRKLHSAYGILLTAILGLTLSAFYWVPVFAEMKYTNVLSQIGGGADFHNHFVCLEQLWQSQWGFGGSTAGCTDGLSFMVGKMHILLSFGAIFLLPFIWKRKSTFIVSILSLVGLLVSILLMLSVSQTIWEKIPQMAFVQYPWRYLLFASFFTSLLGGMVGSFVFSKQKMLGIGICLIVTASVLFLNFKYFQPQVYIPLTSQSLTSPLFLQWTTSKISDEYMPKLFQKPLNQHELPTSFIHSQFGVSIKQQEIKTNEKSITLVLSKSDVISLNLAYFPGWEVLDNRKPIQTQQTRQGINLYLPSGLHTLTVRYTGTFVENVSNTISVTSVIILILGIIWKVTQKKYEHKNT